VVTTIFGNRRKKDSGLLVAQNAEANLISRLKKGARNFWEHVQESAGAIDRLKRKDNGAAGNVPSFFRSRP